jgi:hypothetical protein
LTRAQHPGSDAVQFVEPDAVRGRSLPSRFPLSIRDDRGGGRRPHQAGDPENMRVITPWTPDWRNPVATQKQITTGDRGRNLTDRQDAPNAD